MGKIALAAPRLREDLAVCAQNIHVSRVGHEEVERAAGLSTNMRRSECSCLLSLNALARSLAVFGGLKTTTTTIHVPSGELMAH